MKKFFEFGIALLGPTFLFTLVCCMFNWSGQARISVAEIALGSILFIAVQAVFYKLLHHKFPDVLIRISLPMNFIATLAGLYLSDILSPAETKISVIFLGFVLIIGLMCFCPPRKK